MSLEEQCKNVWIPGQEVMVCRNAFLAASVLLTHKGLQVLVVAETKGRLHTFLIPMMKLHFFLLLRGTKAQR